MSSICLNCGCVGCQKIDDYGAIYYGDLDTTSSHEGDCPSCKEHNVIDVDEDIMWHIFHLNKGNYTTYHSCGGHANSNNYDMYITLSCDTIESEIELIKYFDNVKPKMLKLEMNERFFDFKSGEFITGFVIRNNDIEDSISSLNNNYTFLDIKHIDRKHKFLSELKSLVISLCIEKKILI